MSASDVIQKVMAETWVVAIGCNGLNLKQAQDQLTAIASEAVIELNKQFMQERSLYERSEH